MLQGGYKLPACDDSEECLSFLASALVVFLKHWLSNPQGIEGIMQSLASCFCAWFFDFFAALRLSKALFFSSAAEAHTFISTVEFSRKEYHRSGTLLYSTRRCKTCDVENIWVVKWLTKMLSSSGYLCFLLPPCLIRIISCLLSFNSIVSFSYNLLSFLFLLFIFCFFLWTKRFPLSEYACPCLTFLNLEKEPVPCEGKILECCELLLLFSALHEL